MKTLFGSWAKFVLVIIFLGALFFRVWGIGWDHLYTRHHDELIHLHTATIFSQGELSPRTIWEKSRYPKYVLYPWFSMYVVGGAYRIWNLADQGAKVLLTHPDQLDGTPMLKPGKLTPQKALLLGRLVIAFLGAGTVLAVYGLGRLLINRPAGLLASALLALTGYHMANSHWLKNDISTLFFLVVGIYLCARYLKGGGFLNCVWACLFVAMGVNSKYHVFPGFIVILAAIALRGRGGWSGFLRRIFSLKSLLVLAMALFFLVLTFPLIYLDFEYFSENIIDYLFRMPNEYLLAGGQQYSSFQIWYNNSVNLVRFCLEMEHGMGIPATILGLLGLFYALWRHERDMVFLAIFPGLYIPLAIFGASPGLRLQDTIPLYPFLDLLTALFLFRLSIFVFRRRWLSYFAFLILSILILVPYLKGAIRMSYGFWQPDTCDYATDWALRSIPPGSRVARENKSVGLPDGRFVDLSRRRLCVAPVDRYADQNYRYLVTTSRQANRMSDPYGEYGPEHPYGRFYGELDSRYALIKEFSLGDVPYKGGDIRIWEIISKQSLVPYGLNSGLLRHFAADYFVGADRILFPGPGGRCEGETGFIISPEEKESRLILSRKPLEILGAEVTNGCNSGMVRISSGGDKEAVRLAPGKSTFFIFSPKTVSPEINYSYRVIVSSPWNSPSWARVLTNSFRVGLAGLASGSYEQAIPWLKKAAEENPRDWYPVFLLSDTYRRLDKPEESSFWRKEAEKRCPGLSEFLLGLGDPSLSRFAWRDRFFKLTGYSPDWIEEKVGAPPLKFLLQGDQSVSESMALAPGHYRFFCEVPRSPEPLRVEIRASGEFSKNWEFPSSDGPSRIQEEFQLEVPVSDLVVVLSGTEEASGWIRPDLRRWCSRFQEAGVVR